MLYDTGRHFIKALIDQELEEGKHDGQIVTRFPPEPNGYLHIGHAKAIWLNFGLAGEYKGDCNLRFDDTNPVKEDIEYVESIQEDISWLGYQWNGEVRYASDYFEKLFEFALQLIESGNAYVDGLSAEQMRSFRGTLTEPGKNSPDRDRPIQESIDLFRRMRQGEFEEGQYTLRAKIDMSSPNLNLRDPALYRIRKVNHHRTGDAWSIYPMYDYAHSVSDALEGITHSICTLEFEDHRPLYNWILEKLGMSNCPRQIEFSRQNLDYTVMAKRKLLQLMEEKKVTGWDDPRIPTISGFRRRGYTPESIRTFCSKTGVTKKDFTSEISLLENCIREDLDPKVSRKMVVLRPLKVIILNYPDEKVEMLRAQNHPKDESKGERELPFSREIYIDRDDFMEEPKKKFFRLSPGKEVRLKYAYIIKCEKVLKNDVGEILELHCTYDPASKSGSDTSGKKVKGTIHWVSIHHSLQAEVRLYDRLFSTPFPDKDPEGRDFIEFINPSSLKVLKNARLEPSLGSCEPGAHFQFERVGFFCADRCEHESSEPVFNRTVTLRDSWSKIKKSETSH